MNVREFDEDGPGVASFDGSQIIGWPAVAEVWVYCQTLFAMGLQTYHEDILPKFTDAREFLDSLKKDTLAHPIRREFLAELPFKKVPRKK